MGKINFEKLYNEISKENSELKEKLEEYEFKVFPKFNIGQKIYAVHPNNDEPLEIRIDVIEISKLGVAYIEYVDEQNIKRMPELFCFGTKAEAEYNMNIIKCKRENS